MNAKKIQFAALIVLIMLILVSVISATTAANTIPPSRLDQYTNGIDANALKPTQCSALNLIEIVECTGLGTCNGTNARELIIGSPIGETIRGRGGRDCIIGGDGDDNLVGNGGNDVCIGGPGTDTFTNCETQIQ
jgi:Ca2+-binding RTX toxin-like protein